MKFLARAIVVAAVVLVVATSAAAQESTDEGAKHPSLQLAAGLRLEFLARVQVDARFAPDEASPTEDEGRLDIARRRVGVRGRVSRAVGFELEAEAGAAKPWRDAYVEYRQVRAIRVRAGRFKVPFSLDHTTAATNLDFIDRSRAATQLALGRDQGVMAHGRIWKKRLEYELGAFRDERTTAVRLTFTPFAGSVTLLEPLHTAVAFTSGHAAERLVESAWIHGERRRTGFELKWRRHPVGVTAEYIRATDERLGQSTTGEDLPSLVAASWYVAGTWAVGGARRAVRPRVELAARVEGFRAGTTKALGSAAVNPRAATVSGPSDHALTLGVNCYVNRWVKLQANGVRGTFVEPGRTPSWTSMVRFQVSI